MGEFGTEENFLYFRNFPPSRIPALTAPAVSCAKFYLHSMRNPATALVLVCFMLVATSVSARQAAQSPAQVRAAFLYNFAQFIEWPSQAFASSDTPFTICVTGDSFDGALNKTVDGEMIGGRRIAVRRMDTSDNVRGCHLVYVGRLEAHRSTDVINAAGDMPVLTVGDSENFIDAGGMIRFTEAGPRIRFEINPDAAEKASLRVSSRLLQLADIARPRSRDDEFS